MTEWGFLWGKISLKLNKCSKRLMQMTKSPPVPPQPGFDVSYINHHFYLKATRCLKGSVESKCRFRSDRVSDLLWRVWNVRLVLTRLFCLCAAALRLRSLLQNIQGSDRAGAWTVCWLHQETGSDPGEAAQYSINGNVWHFFTPKCCICVNFCLTTGDDDCQRCSVQSGGIQHWIDNAAVVD